MSFSQGVKLKDEAQNIAALKGMSMTNIRGACGKDEFSVTTMFVENWYIRKLSSAAGSFVPESLHKRIPI